MRLARYFSPASIAMTLLFCATAFCANVDALKNTTPLQRAKLQTAFMKKRLNLTKPQIPKVMDINLKYAEQMDPVLKGNEGRLMKMKQAAEIRKAKDKELTSVLTPAQYQAYLASKEQMQQKMIEKVMQKRNGGG